MAAQDLTTIANVKQWLPITSANTDDDTTITRLITAVSQDFQRATNRPDLLLASYTEVHQGDGSARMIAFHWPIAGIATLQVAGSSISQSSDKIQPGWYIDQDIDPERCWEIYLAAPYLFTDGASIALGYSAGYLPPGSTPSAGQTLLPGDIEQAVIDWIAYRYKERPNVGVKMRRTNQGETSEPEQIDAPPNVLEVIKRYERKLPSIDRRGDERQERIARPAVRPMQRAR